MFFGENSSQVTQTDPVISPLCPLRSGSLASHPVCPTSSSLESMNDCPAGPFQTVRPALPAPPNRSGVFDDPSYYPGKLTRRSSDCGAQLWMRWRRLERLGFTVAPSALLRLSQETCPSSWNFSSVPQRERHLTKDAD